MKQRIDTNKFFEWSKQYHFRQSCDSDHRPREPKSAIVPNYSGFLPYIRSSALVGKSTSALGKQAFVQIQPNNQHHLASTGLNVGRVQPGDLDPTWESSSYSYGVPTMPSPHPCMNFRSGSLESQYQSNYKAPQTQPNPTYRYGETVSRKAKVIRSGFSANLQEFDGKGFPKLPEHGSSVSSQYRDTYNKQIPYQRDPTQFKPRQLPSLLH